AICRSTMRSRSAETGDAVACRAMTIRSPPGGRAPDPSRANVGLVEGFRQERGARGSATRHLIARGEGGRNRTVPTAHGGHGRDRRSGLHHTPPDQHLVYLTFVAAARCFEGDTRQHQATIGCRDFTYTRARRRRGGDGPGACARGA